MKNSFTAAAAEISSKFYFICCGWMNFPVQRTNLVFIIMLQPIYCVFLDHEVKPRRLLTSDLDRWMDGWIDGRMDG